MQDYVKPTKQGFNQDLYIFHAGTDDFLHKENCNGIVNVAESLKYNQLQYQSLYCMLIILPICSQCILCPPSENIIHWEQMG